MIGTQIPHCNTPLRKLSAGEFWYSIKEVYPQLSYIAAKIPPFSTKYLYEARFSLFFNQNNMS